MATNPRTHLPSTDLKVDKELQSVDGAPVAALVRYWGVPDTPSTRPNQPPTSTDPATTRPASRPERTPSTPPTPHHNPPLTSANVLNVRSHLNVGRPPQLGELWRARSERDPPNRTFPAAVGQRDPAHPPMAAPH